MTIEGVITKLPPAIVTGPVIVFWVFLSRLLLLWSGLWSCWSFLDVTFILPELIDGIKDLFGFTLDFLTDLKNKEDNQIICSKTRIPS